MGFIMKKKVIITGANGKLGSAFVEALSRKGYFVYAVDLNIEKIIISENVQPVELDITNEIAVHKFFSSIQDLDVLINNAGIGVFTSFEDRTASEFKKVMEVNLLGTFLMSQSAVKIMKSNDGGKIVNIASIYGFVAPRFDIYEKTSMTTPVEYAAIKSGLLQLTKYMTKYLKDMNIRINAISPGGILDQQPEPFLKAYQRSCANKGMLDKGDLGGTLVFLLSDLSQYVNGHNLVVDDGFSL